MLKELIKIQIIVVLIFVMNAIATQNLKFIGGENTSTGNVKSSKIIEDTKAQQVTHSSLISATNPRKVLLDALTKSLN